jgi:DNA-binding transcriptional ArsR family regulator
MVEYTLHLDGIFHSLADPIRRDILRRVAERNLSIGELVEKYEVSFAAISKHINVLEQAKLVRRRKEGRRQFVVLQPATLKEADAYLEQYRRMWESRYDKLEKLLEEGE